MKKNIRIWVATVTVIVVTAAILTWLALTGGGAHTPTLPISFDTPDAFQTSSTTSTPLPGTSAAKKIAALKKQDVVTIIKGIKGTSLFGSYFRSTGVAAMISASTSTKYTIFVPSNGAFAQLAGSSFSSLSASDQKRIMEYHVIVGRAMDMTAVSSGSVVSLSGDPLNFTYGSNKVPMVNSALVVGRYEGKNGVVIVIDNVLLPPKK